MRVSEGSTILDACRQLGIETPTLCYGETLHAGERLPRLRGRGRGLRACSCRRARGRSRPDGGAAPTPSACSYQRRLVLELLARRSTSRPTPAAPATWRRTRPTRSASGRRRRRIRQRDRAATGHHTAPDGLTPPPCTSRSRSTTSSTSATTASASSATSASTPAASSTRTRSPSTSPGRGFDARISTEFDVGAARLGLRLLRQLHRGLPHRRADVHARSTSCARRATGTRTSRPSRRRSAPTAASAATSSCTCRTTDRQGDESRRPRRHPRQPLHQGPLRLPARSGATRLGSGLLARPERRDMSRDELRSSVSLDPDVGHQVRLVAALALHRPALAVARATSPASRSRARRSPRTELLDLVARRGDPQPFGSAADRRRRPGRW